MLIVLQELLKEQCPVLYLIIFSGMPFQKVPSFTQKIISFPFNASLSTFNRVELPKNMFFLRIPWHGWKGKGIKIVVFMGYVAMTMGYK